MLRSPFSGPFSSPTALSPRREHHFRDFVVFNQSWFPGTGVTLARWLSFRAGTPKVVLSPRREHDFHKSFNFDQLRSILVSLEGRHSRAIAHVLHFSAWSPHLLFIAHSNDLWVSCSQHGMVAIHVSNHNISLVGMSLSSFSCLCTK